MTNKKTRVCFTALQVLSNSLDDSLPDAWSSWTSASSVIDTTLREDSYTRKDMQRFLLLLKSCLLLMVRFLDLWACRFSSSLLGMRTINSPVSMCPTAGIVSTPFNSC